MYNRLQWNNIRIKFLEYLCIGSEVISGKTNRNDDMIRKKGKAIPVTGRAVEAHRILRRRGFHNF
jgi:hypothetical protein